MESILENAVKTDKLYHNIKKNKFLIRQNNLFGIIKFSTETNVMEEIMFNNEKSLEIKEKLWDHIFTKRLVTPSSFDTRSYDLYEAYGGLDKDQYRSQCNMH